MIGEDALTVLRRSWRNQSPFGLFRPLYASITFVEDRLELGAGTVLARMARGDLGETVLAFEGGEDRALALLAVAYLRPVQAQALVHLRRGAQEWARGERCLAHLHLAFGGLSKLDEPEEAAFRIFVADNLLKARVPAQDLLKAFGLDVGLIDHLGKFSPDQLRVARGNGRPSGQWTKEDGSGGAISSAASAVASAAASMVAGAESFFVEDVAPKALAGLSEMAAGFSAPALTLGLLFVPSPGGGSVTDGAVPGQSNLLYHWDQQAGEVVLSWSIAGNAVPFNSAKIGAGGLYYDANQQPIARVLNGVLVIDAATATAPQRADDDEQARTAAPPVARAIANDNNKPKLCPDPGSDTPHGASERANAYQERVTGLPVGLAVWLNGVPFDGCRPTDGVMLEGKADYDQFIDNETGRWQKWFGGASSLMTQLESQSIAAAAAGRRVEWHVAEPRPAALIKEMAARFANIDVFWDPR